MATLDYFHLYINFRMILSIFSKKPSRILIKTMTESVYQFRENGYAINIEFFNLGLWLTYATI